MLSCEKQKNIVAERKFSSHQELIVDYVTGAESKQLTRAEFEERGEAERLKLHELIALLSKPVTYTILISNER